MEEKKSYTCKECEAIFVTKKILWIHWPTGSEEKKYTFKQSRHFLKVTMSDLKWFKSFLLCHSYFIQVALGVKLSSCFYGLKFWHMFPFVVAQNIFFINPYNHIVDKNFACISGLS